MTATDYPLSLNPAYQIYDGKMEEEPLHCEGCGDKCEELKTGPDSGYQLCEGCYEYEIKNPES